MIIDDDLANHVAGVAQQARFEKLRNDVAALEDEYPFLLFPVRIETRFMRVATRAERAWDDVAPVEDAASTVRDALARVASVEIPKGTSKRLRKRRLRELEAAVREVESASSSLRFLHDEVFGGAEPARSGPQDVSPLEAELDAALTRLGAQRSAFMRTALSARLAPLRATLRGAALALDDKPFERFRRELAPRDSAEVDALLDRALELAAATPSQLDARAVRHLIEPLGRVDSLVVIGDEGELRGLAEKAGRLHAKVRELMEDARHVRRRDDLTATHEALARFAQPPRELAREEILATSDSIARLRRHLGALRVDAQPRRARAVPSPPPRRGDPELAALVRRTRLLPAGLEQELGSIAPDTIGRRRRSAAAGVTPWAALSRRVKRVGHELWVRVFPDDVVVDSFEKALTAAEVESGRRYQHAVALAADDQAARRDAWRLLCREHGASRAAWIALQVRLARKPVDDAVPIRRALLEVEASLRRCAETGARDHLDDALQGLEACVPVPLRLAPRSKTRLQNAAVSIEARLAGLAALVADADWREACARGIGVARQLADGARAASVDESSGELTEMPPLKDEAWTRAPDAPLLPDLFVVVLLRRVPAAEFPAAPKGPAEAFEVRHVRVGNPIPADLKVGLDPKAGPGAFALDTATGHLTVDDSIRWMVDFDEAVRRGMAVRVPITEEEATTGFHRVYVAGIKRADAAALDRHPAERGGALLKQWLESHRFGLDGASFLPVGSPTNNTEDESSAYRSREDPDQSFDLERGAPQFETRPAAVMADGRLFARALGLQPSVVHRFAHAGTAGVTRTRWMHDALWPATLGNYLRSFAGLALGTEMKRRIEALFRQWVIPRGVLPTLRIGRQPYGVLVTTSLHRFMPPDDRHDQLMFRFLRTMADDFTKIRASRVRHAHEPNIGDPHQHFLNLVGHQATSVNAAYRFSMNVARRHPVQLPGTPGLWQGMLGELRGEDAAELGPAALIERYRELIQQARDIAANTPLIEDGQFVGGYRTVFAQLLHARAFEVRYLTNAKPLSDFVAEDDFAVWLTATLTKTPRELQVEAKPGTGPQSLLRLLVRHALLAGFRDAALDLSDRRLHRHLDTTGLGWSNAFLMGSLRGDYTISEWSLLFTRVRELDGALGYEFDMPLFQRIMAMAPDLAFAELLAPRAVSPLLDQVVPIGVPERGEFVAALELLAAQAASVQRLASFSASELRQIAVEHVDAVSHRLDAWLLGFPARKLDEMRGRRPKGTYVGAFGWVEDLKPAPPRSVAPDVPAELSTAVVHVEEGNQGFILAPSLDHAATAAILRSGYTSEHAQPDLDNRLAVNLSSRRVRLALRTLEELRAGIELGTALGYQLERSLHDAFATTGVTLDGMLGALRRRFPGRPAFDPANDDPDRARRLVVDGLALLGTVRAAIGETAAVSVGEAMRGAGAYPAYPWGLVDLDDTPVVAKSDGARLDALILAVDALADTLDALGDLAVSESVFQIARGNHPRAAATFSALASGKAPPWPEVVDTPVAGALVSHRVLLHLPRAGADLAGWPAASPRALAAPDLDAWLRELAGPSGTLIATVTTPAGDTVAVRYRDLGARPVDLLAMIGSDSRRPELELHVAWPARADAPGPLGTITYEQHFLDFLGLLATIGELLTTARAAGPADFEIAAGAAPIAEGVDLAELAARAKAIYDVLGRHALALARLLAGNPVLDAAVLDEDPAAKVRDEAWNVHRKDHALVDAAPILGDWARWAELLLAGGRLALSPAGPPSLSLATDVLAEALLTSVEATYVAATIRWQYAAAKMAKASSAAELVALMSELLVDSVRIIPRMSFAPSAGLDAAFAAPIADGPLLVEQWLPGVAAVRDPMRHLMHIRLYTEALGIAVDPMIPIQQPHERGHGWIGVTTIDDDLDRLSLVVVRPDAWAANTPSSTLVVDQWNERIPATKQRAAAAFHYNRPDAMPPQALLLVVPPRNTGAWSFEDLLHALHDTVELAKLRLVEPEHLDGSIYGQILPAIVGEIVPEGLQGEGTLQDQRVTLDFGNLVAPSPSDPG